MTIARLPSSFKRAVHVTPNDHDLDVTATSTILLLMLLAADDLEQL